MGCSAWMTRICQQTCPCSMYAGMHNNQSNPEEALGIRRACMPFTYGLAPAEPIIVVLTMLHENILSVLEPQSSHKKVQAGLKSARGL